MDETTRHTIKISTTALQALRVIAAYTGKHQNALIEEWAQRELARIIIIQREIAPMGRELHNR